jgi:ribose transport system permease protein
MIDFKFIRKIDTSIVLIGILIMAAIAAALLNPYFLRADNLQNLSRNTGFFLIFALAQMLPILVRGLDLSQGGLVAITSVGAAILASEIGVWPSFFICVASAALFGFVQGWLVGKFSLSAFVVTLGGGSVLGGCALLLSNGQTIYEVPPDFKGLGWTDIVGIPLVAGTSLAFAVLIWWLLSRTSLGRQIYAVGSNPKASTIIGINLPGVTMACYVLAAAITAIGALFLSSRITSGSPVIGSDVALQSIAATVVGGVSLFGGRGHVLGVMFGAFVLAVLANLLNLYNISSYWQAVLFGLVIILAVAFDRLRTHR